MPIQLCALLQGDPLNIPVQTIDWGHPNIRNGFAKEYYKGRENAWAREHQLKIFAEDFESIGFRIEHKNKILEEMADSNRSLKLHSDNILCMPPKKITKTKVDHPQEDSEKLPNEIRCKHFDAYWRYARDWVAHKVKVKKILRI
jgi:hypothetical protein